MRRFAAGLCLVALLAACGQAEKSEMADHYNAMAPAAMEQQVVAEIAGGAQDAMPAAEARAGDGATLGQPSQPSGPTPVFYLAYSYQRGLEVPSQNLTAIVDSHVQACQTAGPRLCQLIGSNVSGDPESQMNGNVSLRGEPNWLATFMGGLETQAEAAGGRLLAQSTNTEDLTRAIVDTEARQRAQTALRDRLQRLLDNRPGRLADLLEVEREMARVQGELDALQSGLAVMRTRVAMSELNVQYQSSAKPLRGDTFRPLGEALANFLGIVVSGFAAIIVVIAGLLPFAIVIIPIVWGLLRWRRARGGRFFALRVEGEKTKGSET